MSFKHKKSKEHNRQVIQKTCSLRLYPNQEQERLFANYFGVSRYVYNRGLKLKKEAYAKDKTNLSYRALAKFLTKWRETVPWIQKVSCAVEQASLQHLDEAFRNFFRRLKSKTKEKGFPRFKKKHGKQSFEFPARVRVKEGKVKLPKIGEFKFLNYSGYLDDKTLGKTTIVKSSTGKYYAQVLVKTEKKIPKKLPVYFENTVGIDLGLLNYIVASNGFKISNPKFFKILEMKKRRLSRWLSRTQKGSKNRIKARLRLTRCYEQTKNKVNNFLHSTVNQLVRDNQANRFVLETLNIKGMQKNHRLAGSVQQASWAKFQYILEYKARWCGKTVVYADPFFPSSKQCSACGGVNKNLQINDREWVCPSCGAWHDRDVNSSMELRLWPEISLAENRAGAARIAERENAHANASGEGVLVQSAAMPPLKALVERGNPDGAPLNRLPELVSEG